MVNTSVNLPQSKDRSGSTRSDCKIASRFTCPACPPSNTIHHLEEITCTARLPVNLSIRGLLTSPQIQPTDLQVGLGLLPLTIRTTCLIVTTLFLLVSRSLKAKSTVTTKTDLA
ncbi:hypothetical protein CHARACLAT_029460 [Characodon lateralis]|uniref:Uncharacterized protein n=1 Tax=Characodon lateralis TaxID=208331 RepID=A0ABU7DNW9_9TELE|nr:hypothetical protein [Characodon lateralis]